MFVNPLIATGDIPASDAPATTASQTPHWIQRAAWPIECVPLAQAVEMVSQGPSKPCPIETAAAPALGIIIGMVKGETRRDPF